MEKLVLVTHDKYQRLLGEQSTKDMEPTTLKRKIVPEPPPGKREKSKKDVPSRRLYTVKDWISF